MSVARAYEPGSGATMPQVIHDPRPGYTSQAMQAKVQGIVLLEAVVLPDGRVGPVRVARSLDQRFGLDDEAVRSYRARFNRLRLELAQASRRAGARFVHVVAGTPIRQVARELAAAGVLETA